jgi:AraC-like DNA-binding protein
MHQQQQIDYRRVERGIAYIAAHFRECPALEDVAAAAHVSPFHFQRMFTAWAGVSPKTFARYLSLDHARKALRDGGASLLGAALDSGLSGPGRLHDLFVSVEGMAPGDYARGGAGLAIRYGHADSLFGRLFIASTPRGICHMAFDDEGEDRGAGDKGAGVEQLRRMFPAADIMPGDAALHDDAAAAWPAPCPVTGRGSSRYACIFAAARFRSRYGRRFCEFRRRRWQVMAMWPARSAGRMLRAPWPGPLAPIRWRC